jgi:hypothetical protein
MKYIGYLLAAVLLAGFAWTPLRAQSAEDSVKAAVNLLFTGMKDADASTIRRAFTDSAILQTILTGKEGKTAVRTEGIEEFAAAIAKLGKGVADERIRFDVVKIDGPLAIVWAPYSFYYKGQLNHCGVDSFQLLLVDGVWRIQYIIDTRRKSDCK